MSYYQQERCRFIIEEARTGRILTRDLQVQEPKLVKKLSGPCTISFKVDQRNSNNWDPDNGGPILFKPWGHWCHVEKNMPSGERRILMSGIFKPSQVDPQSGVLAAEFEGFSNYPKKIPWLQNWNPIAIDPAAIVDRIWKHVQSYVNGNLGVTCYSLKEDGTKQMPPTTNTLLLPGFSFDGNNFIQNFFAIFIRRTDMTDCGDYIEKLARDIPFDYFEESNWNTNQTAVEKWIQIAYPAGGALQSNLAFRFNENVLYGKPKIESEIEWASDVIIRGWFPGKVYSSQLTNEDPLRYRRTVLEEDVRISSNERAAAWGHRQLTRRQFPHYWEQITINMNHPNAPFGTWDVGDQIRVQGVMPFVGDVDQVHKIIAWEMDEKAATCVLYLRADGAFNYDPIYFNGELVNLLQNPSFTNSMFSWQQANGVWYRDALSGYNSLGSVWTHASGSDLVLQSEQIAVLPGQKYNLACSTFWEDLVVTPGIYEPIQVGVNRYDDSGALLGTVIFDSIAVDSSSADDWHALSNSNYTIPAGTTRSVRVIARVTPDALSGKVGFDEFYFTRSA